MLKSSNRATQFTGKHMLIIMCCLFGVIISVNMTMAYFATTTWTGLVVKNSYVESQKFNSYFKESEKQIQLGWTGKITTKQGLLTIRFQDKTGKPLNNLRVSAVAQRPAHENEDTILQINFLSDGKYSHTKNLAPGLWNIKLVARGQNKQKFKQISQIEIE